MNFKDNRIKRQVYERLYLKRDKNDKIIETIEECHARIANYLGETSEEKKIFKEILDSDSFRPNTPTMMNAGIEGSSLCACYIVGLEDSMESISKMWKIVADIYKDGGGAGIPITKLREKGAPISTGGFASGPLSYLHVVEEISKRVKSGGRTRRAANLVSAMYNHPDTRDIVKAKVEGESVLQSMNLSVCVDFKFMECVKKGSGTLPYKSPSPLSKFNGKEFNTIDLWNDIVDSAWACGDPGLLFFDRLNQDNPSTHFGDIISTNPCGEVAGPEWMVCVLGHINLNKILKEEENGFFIDWDKFAWLIKWGVLFLNRILDKSAYPSPEFKDLMENLRPIGLGVIGFADFLAKLGISYTDKKKVREIVDLVFGYLTSQAYYWSHLFFEDGYTKPISVKCDRMEDLLDRYYYKKIDMLKHYGLNPDYIHEVKFDPSRLSNSLVTCIAPTGSTALSCGASYSFNPFFSICWKKKLVGGDEWFIVPDSFIKICEKKGISVNEKQLNEIYENKGSLKGISEFEEVAHLFPTELEIPYDYKVEVQAAVQNNITMSVSNTINLPNSATKEDVARIFIKAYELNLKGITIFRDGCKDSPVEFGKKDKVEKTKIVEFRRPFIRYGKQLEVSTPRGKLYVRGNFIDDKLMEIFLDLTPVDGFGAVAMRTLARYISKSLQIGCMTVDDVVDILSSCGGEKFFMYLPDKGKSVGVDDIFGAVAYLVDNYLRDFRDVSTNVDDLTKCPKCGKRSFKKGIGACRSGMCTNPECGYSACE